MKVSLNTIKQYTDIDLSVDELVAKINAQLGGVEEVINLGERYKDAIIVKVVSCEKHSDADKLSVCKIDTGTGELVQVVCGAPNVRADMFAVWLPPKSTVPSSFEDKEPFVLEARELRGVVSNGMLASPKELGLGDSHEGLLDLTGEDVKPGDSFAKKYGLDDTIIEIENKMFTHRPDLFGQLGVAREISAILKGVTEKEEGVQDTRFENPDWYWNTPEFSSGDNSLALEVINESPDEVPRFMAVAIKNVEVKPSPVWLQAELVRLGGKPINNIVDATNYVMLLTAQPTHAYDYDKLRGHKLVSRLAKKGETATLLNGKTYEFDETDIVIADGEGVVGLAGIMGGGESEVSAETKNIVLEVATFDMYSVRRSSMRHGLFTDALTRFNKGQSPLQNAVVLAKLMELIGGEQASTVFDINNISDPTTLSGNIVIETDFINQRLGSDLSSEQIGNLLRRVNFAIIPNEKNKAANVYTAPFWRTDIELPEDIIEEVGRLYGYDALPRELPQRSAKPAPKNASRELAKTIRETLARAGANEVLTYSFVHKNVIERASQNSEHAYQIANALSPDLQYYRLSLTPSLLDKVHMNIKAGYNEFALFEIGKGHNKEHVKDGLPEEVVKTAFVYASKVKTDGATYYSVKKHLNYLLNQLSVSVFYRSIDDVVAHQTTQPFEHIRSAEIVDKVSGTVLGIIGEFKQSVIKGFKLPIHTAGFELSNAKLLEVMSQNSRYKSLSKYPSTSRDISFRVDKQTAYGEIIEQVAKTLGDINIDSDITPGDIYQGDDEKTKTITISVTLASHQKTLSSDEANAIVDTLTKAVVQATGAEII